MEQFAVVVPREPNSNVTRRRRWRNSTIPPVPNCLRESPDERLEFQIIQFAQSGSAVVHTDVWERTRISSAPKQGIFRRLGPRYDVSSYTVALEIPEDCEMEQAGEVVEIEVSEDEYVLAAARDTGIWLPADCQQGWCTTCAAELLEGDIDQSDARRYFEADEEADMILSCTAKPRSDLRIRACQHEAMLDHRAEHDLPPGNAKR